MMAPFDLAFDLSIQCLFAKWSKGFQGSICILDGKEGSFGIQYCFLLIESLVYIIEWIDIVDLKGIMHDDIKSINYIQNILQKSFGLSKWKKKP